MRCALWPAPPAPQVWADYFGWGVRRVQKAPCLIKRAQSHPSGLIRGKASSHIQSTTRGWQRVTPRFFPPRYFISTIAWFDVGVRSRAQVPLRLPHSCVVETAPHPRDRSISWTRASRCGPASQLTTLLVGQRAAHSPRRGHTKSRTTPRRSDLGRAPVRVAARTLTHTQCLGRGRTSPPRAGRCSGRRAVTVAAPAVRNDTRNGQLVAVALATARAPGPAVPPHRVAWSRAPGLPVFSASVAA